MVQAGCWAHARRYFIDALKVHPSDGLAAEFVRRIEELFAVDREAWEGGVSQSERAELRREKSAKRVEASAVTPKAANSGHFKTGQ